MNRSQKIRRFFYQKDRELKIIDMGYVEATIFLLEEHLNTLRCRSQWAEPSKARIASLKRRVDILGRQLFVLDNPSVDFEVEALSKVEMKNIKFDGSRDVRYRVIFSEDDEVLYQLGRRRSSS